MESAPKALRVLAWGLVAFGVAGCCSHGWGAVSANRERRMLRIAADAVSDESFHRLVEDAQPLMLADVVSALLGLLVSIALITVGALLLAQRGVAVAPMLVMTVIVLELLVVLTRLVLHVRIESGPFAGPGAKLFSLGLAFWLCWEVFRIGFFFFAFRSMKGMALAEGEARP